MKEPIGGNSVAIPPQLCELRSSQVLKNIKEKMIFANKKKQEELQKKINLADSYLDNSFHKLGAIKNKIEDQKSPLRTEIINFLIKSLDKSVKYLEIGVRNPDDNFNKITAEEKYSVDPGYENSDNNVDFKMTSDEFFTKNRIAERQSTENSRKFSQKTIGLKSNLILRISSFIQ